MGLWVHTYVGTWVCVYMGLWVRGYVGMWVRGSVGMWVLNSMGLLVCGSVGLGRLCHFTQFLGDSNYVLPVKLGLIFFFLSFPITFITSVSSQAI